MKCHTYKYLLVTLLGLMLAFTFCSSNPVSAQEEPQFNLLWMREAYIKDGKMMEAIQFAKEITEYDNKLINGKTRVYIEVFGDLGKIYWVAENVDLATMESNNRKLMADPGHRALLGKAVGLFIEGRGKDTLMAVIR